MVNAENARGLIRKNVVVEVYGIDIANKIHPSLLAIGLTAVWPICNLVKKPAAF
jgi:hypothetical protein